MYILFYLVGFVITAGVILGLEYDKDSFDGVIIFSILYPITIPIWIIAVIVSMFKDLIENRKER